MSVDTVAEAFREGIWVVVKISGPMLVLSMVVGIFLALFQAVTAIKGFVLSRSLRLRLFCTLIPFRKSIRKDENCELEISNQKIAHA